MKNKKNTPTVFLNSEGLPFGHSAEKNKNKMVARILFEEGFDVYSVHKIKHAENRKFGFSQSVKFIFLNCVPKSGIQKVFSFVGNLRKEFLILKKVRRKIDNNTKCFLILAYSPFVLVLYYKFISKLLNIHLIISIMEWHVAVPSKNILQKYNKYLFDYHSFALADGAIPITELIDNKIKKRHPKTKTYILPAITDYTIFNQIKAEDDATQRKVLYCGGLGYFEVIKFVIDSFKAAEVKNSELTLIVNGTKEDKNKLFDYIKRVDLKDVLVKSDLTFEELIKEYKSAQALLIPLRDTPQDNARFPHKISEYVASKTPIITTNTGVIRKYFDSDSAYIADKYEISSFAEKIENCLNADNTLLINNAYQIGLANFNYSAHKDELKKFLLEI